MRRLKGRLVQGCVVAGATTIIMALAIAGGSPASATGPGINDGDVGSNSSMVLDNNGYPVVAYTDDTNGDLKILRCGNQRCSSATTVTTPDSAGFVGGGPSMALDSRDFPVVSYTDYARYELKILRCGNATCSAGNTIQTIETGGTVGGKTSLALDRSNRPVVAFTDYASSRIVVVRCATSACDGAVSIAPELSPPDSSEPTLVLNRNDVPVMSFYSRSNLSLNLLHCGDTSCTSGNRIVRPDNGPLIGTDSSMVLDRRDFPVLSYRDNWNNDLIVLRCGSEICTDDNSITRPDTDGVTGGQTAIALDAQDRPIVSYLTWTGEDLKILRCGDTSCAAGNNVAVVDSVGSVGRESSISFVPTSGLAVSYYDTTNGDLKIYRATDQPSEGEILAIAEPAASPAASATPRPTARPPAATAIPRPTARPVATATPRPTPRPAATATATATARPTVRPTATAAATPRPTPRPAATATPTPRPAATPRPTPAATPRPAATVRPTPRPAATPRPTATAQVLSITVPAGSLNQAQLDTARARWDARRPNGYTMTYTWTACCFTAPSTVAHRMTPVALATHWHGESAVGSRSAVRAPLTVDQLFASLEAEIPTTERALRVTFDSALGFPVAIAGDDFTVVVSSFVPEYRVCAGKPVSIFGRSTASSIVGTDLDDVILGGGGNDTIDARGGNDVVCGGSGNDTIAGGAGTDTLLGEGGHDTIRGAGGRDVLQGGPGNDTIYGDSGNDLAQGGDGSDTIFGGIGGDTIYGDNGNDLLLAGPGFDRVYGGVGDDNVQGAGGDDYLDGGAGNDAIYGKPGNDEIRAGAGDDTVYGASGDDVIYGGAGADRLQGASGADELFGDDGDDLLYGQAGDDILAGGDGDDTLFGGGGADQLWGQADTDQLHGGAGNDTCLPGSPGEPPPALCSP